LHAIKVRHHIMVPEAQDAISLRRKKLRPRLIPGAICLMLAAVDLDNQSCCRTGEVGKERLDWHLPLKTPTIETTTAQGRP
jgi:hypothetical protein